MKTNIDTYIFDTLISLKDFEEFWKEGHEQEPSLFPLEMDSGDWQDHFTMRFERQK